MRIANLAGRLVSIASDGAGAVDVEQASNGRFGSDPLAGLDRWDELTDLVAGLPTGDAQPFMVTDLRAPVPLPRQVFAIGLNYRDHAAESGFTELPTSPVVFTKFPACTTGPEATVGLPSDRVDYEVELVVVIGKRAERVTEARAWDHVAGLMVGQDLSERSIQLAGPAPQFSLGKSFTGFGPTGPAIVTLDEFSDVDSLSIGCRIGDEVLQDGNTKDLIFPVPELLARLSRVCPLLPGDVIYTGTPAGVGLGRTPPRMLAPGETLTSWVEGVGEIHTTFTAADDYQIRD